MTAQQSRNEVNMVVPPFDPVTAIAGVASRNSEKIGSLLARIGKATFNNLISQFSSAFSDNLRTTYNKCSRIKTLVHRDAPVDIYSQYVNLWFTSGSLSCQDVDLVQKLGTSTDAVAVSGFAGCGKTMFLRWACMELISSMSEFNRIPLYIELRDLGSEFLSLTVEDFVFRKTSSEQNPRSLEQFKLGVENGLFVIILDGLDEVPHESRPQLLKELADFPRRYPMCSLLVSTRPDEKIETTNSISVFHVDEMTKEQIISVIQNSAFDPDKKAAFIAKITDGLYEEQQSFLSNPLLATIMLITFDNSLAIPHKVTTFYQQAFETLFYRHDASKGVYIREHYSELAIDEFEKVFRRFCFVSYLKSTHAFGYQDIISELKESLLQEGLGRVGFDDVLRDVTETLCLIQKDGLNFTFVHRSFQEYFAARFLLFYRGTEAYALIEGLARKSMSDNVIPMLHEMDSALITRAWVLESVRNQRDLLKKVESGSLDKKVEYVVSFISEIDINRRTGRISLATWLASDRLNIFMNLAQAGCPFTEFVQEAVSEGMRLGDSKEEIKAALASAPIRNSKSDRGSGRREELKISLYLRHPGLFEHLRVQGFLGALLERLDRWLKEKDEAFLREGKSDEDLVDLLRFQ